MAIPGIPNSYKGRNYRSLLETRWAIMFEKLGWQAEYEPFELNGWIPDFILIGKKESLLVEVKPFSHFDQYADAIIKIENGVRGTEYESSEVLLLGIDPARRIDFWPYPMLGWMGEWIGDIDDDDVYRREYSEARIWQSSSGLFGICSSVFSYHDRMNDLEWKDCGDGDHEVSIITKMWADAGSQTQWKAPSFVSKAAASQAEAMKRFALPKREKPEPVLKAGKFGDVAKIDEILAALWRQKYGPLATAIEAAVFVHFSSSANGISEFDGVRFEGNIMFLQYDRSSRISLDFVHHNNNKLREVGLRLFGEPLSVRVSI